MSQHHITLLLGSNLGNPVRNIEIAVYHIENEIGDIIQKSKILLTEPVEFVSNNIFCNIAVLIKTQFSPIKLLDSLKSIEHKMGREFDSMISGAYEDRIIDIDIVLYDKLSFWSLELEIPHKRHIYHRDFSRKLLSELINIKTQ